MNYGVTVEGAPWPAGVMGKADDLGLFDDVNASPDVPAIRGDVVMMIDNSLTVAHLKQTGYGDLKQYEEDPDTTFLSKMKIDELEDARVTAIARVDSTLEDDEIELTTYDSKGNVEDSDVYTLLTDETPEALFGLKVDAWINDDDEIVFVDVATDAKDILLDTVEGTPAKDEIELKVADDTFDVVTDAEAYVNFSTVADFSKLEAGMYGKFVRESGKIAFANLFDFDKKGIVTEVDKNVISFVDATNGDDDEIDLDDYDDVYVYNPDFSKADVKDIKEYSAIFFWEDDDEINIVVKNDSVEGKVDAVKADSIKIDGTWYDKGDDAIVTLDKGDNYDVWEDNNGLDIVEDFVDEDVTAVLDLNGEVMLVTGAAKATSGDLYGIVTYAKDGRYVTLTVFNKDGEEVDYTAESSNEFRDLVGLDYYATGSNVEYAALKYKLTSDSEIAKEKSVVAEIKGTDCTDAYPANTPTTSLLNSEVFEGNLKKGSDKKNITVGTKTFYIASDTVIMQALNTDGELDPSLITVDKFVSLSIENNNEAVVFGENGKDAKFIVMLNKNFEGAEEDLYYGVVTDKPYKSGGSYYATINVFGEGEKDYKIDDAADFPKAKVVCFKFNNKGEATIYEDAVTNKEYSYDDGYVTIGSDIYKVDSSAILYSLDGSDIDKKISRTALKDYTYINYVLDDSNVIVAATVSGKATGEEETPIAEGTVTYIDDSDKAITSDLTLAPTDTQVINVLYKNDSNKLVSLEADAAKLYVEDSDGNEVMSEKNTAIELNPGVSKELFTDLTLAIDSTKAATDKLHPGKAYTVKLLLNGELQEETLDVYVKDNDARLKSFTILGADVSMTNTDNTDETLTLSLPFTGTDLTKLTSKDVVVETQFGNTAVVEVTPAADNTTTDDATVKVTVTAEDGTTTKVYTVTVSKATASDDTTLKSITVGGVVYTSPSPNTAVTLPAGTTETPEVTAVANHAAATVEITDATDVTANDGTANVTTIKVTAEDGTTQDYTITFTVAE